MSKRKLKLEEAKEILESDKVFYNGNSKFNVLDVGKYRSGITIEVPQEWTINKKNSPESPIKYIECKELTDGMNIDFDGEASLLLGRYRLSKNNKPVFELTEPVEAKDVLIRVDWGGAFNKTRGQTNSYAKEIGATFFIEKSSNGGGTGYDYWVLPVGFVKDKEERDISDILNGIQKSKDDRIAEIDTYLENEERERQESIKNRERILREIQPIIQEIQTFNTAFCFEDENEDATYVETKNGMKKVRRYTDSLVRELELILEKEKQIKKAQDEFIPQYKEMEEVLAAMDITISYNDNNVILKLSDSYFDMKSYNYSSDGYISFVNDITNYREKIDKEKEEARIKAEELKRANELQKLKAKAKSEGYPEKFRFWNRLNGATDLSHAYVIESDGTIREPDYNELSNHNHRYRDNWKNNADGTQEYDQILPGEIIVSYTKSVTKTPYVINVEWADGDATEEQLETICQSLECMESFAVDIDENEITSIQEWSKKAIREKVEECRKQLDVEDEFVETIIDYAMQKVEVKNINEQAQELAQKYQQQLSEQQSLEEK